MARIIHVEDETQWIDVVRRALADHEVDSARTWEQALALLRGPGTYDLALIDLNLGGDDDKEGGEVLDLLREDYPPIRRVIITAVPPAGDLRSRIYERYGVQDIIIKDRTTLPDLQLVVRRALKRRPQEISADTNLQASTLRERYQVWVEGIKQKLRSSIREAETTALHLGRSSDKAAQEARAALDDWRAVQRLLAAECAQLDSLISAANTSAEVDQAAIVLLEVQNRIAGEVARLESR